MAPSGTHPEKIIAYAKRLEICESFRRKLKQDGPYLIRVNIVDRYLTEVDATSPMYAQETNFFAGEKLESLIAGSAESLSAKPIGYRDNFW